MKMRRAVSFRKPRGGPNHQFVLTVEAVEKRCLLSPMTFYVETTLDKNTPGVGPLSLREAIEEANANPGDNTIDFSMIEQPDGSTIGPFVIQVGSTGLGPLPPINNAVTIDGYTAPGASESTAPYVPFNTTVNSANQFVPNIVDHAAITVALDGTALKTLPTPANPDTLDGLLITPASTPISTNSSANPDGSVIEGLSIHSFPTDGIGISQSNNNTIEGNFIGLDSTGVAHFSTPGPFELGNVRTGVLVQDGSGNVIGGPDPGDRNIISGNGYDGVALSHQLLPTANGMTGNVIQNNYIGIQSDGETALSNGHDGVDDLGATQTQILGNVISGNLGVGVALLAVAPVPGASSLPFFNPNNNVIQGNIIGLDAAGLNPIIPELTGPQVNGETAQGNVGGGLYISGGSDNIIGLDVNFEPVMPDPRGTASPAAQQAAQDVQEQSNCISGNGDFGVRILSVYDPTTETVQSSAANVLRDNYIGSDRFGFAARGNNTDGIQVIASPNTQIGGPSFEAGNLVSGNNGSGIVLLGSATNQTILLDNYIGTDNNAANGIRSGVFGLGNKQDGVLIEGAPNTVIGGPTETDPKTGRVLTGSNVIAGNGAAGIHIVGDVQAFLKPFVASAGGLVPTFVTPQPPPDEITATGTVIVSDYIGVGFNRNLADPADYDFSTETPRFITAGDSQSNQSNGILIEGAVGTTIGSPQPALGNTIANNGGAGIDITATTPTGLQVPAALAQQEPNVIQANEIGLGYSDQPNPQFPQYAAVQTQFVLPNAGDGILIAGASFTQIGGTGAGEGNYIGGNGGSGIHILGVFPSEFDAMGNPVISTTPITPTGTVIAGNKIGVGVALFQDQAGATQIDSTLVLKNAGDGVLIEGAAQTQVGVPSATGFSNMISGNGGAGIDIIGSAPTPSNPSNPTEQLPTTAVGNTIQNDLIGIGEITGAGFSLFQFAAGNSGDGILIDGALNTLIGGTAAAERNTISGNGAAGIHILGTAVNAMNEPVPVNTLVQGNFIGTDDGGDDQIDISIDPFNLLLDLGQPIAMTSNVGDGVVIDGSSGNVVGGPAAAARNIITGNRGSGVSLIAGATANTIEGNFIGLGQSGTVIAGGNRADGVTVLNAPANVIAANVISGNGENGLAISGASDGTQVIGNLIGTTPSGLASSPGNPTGNLEGGVLVNILVDPGTQLTIGGTNPGDRNIIGGNQIAGITIVDVDVPASELGNVSVVGNYIGISLTSTVNPDGTVTPTIVPAGNVGSGILIENSTEVVIGGTAPGAGNVIACNTGAGILDLQGAGNVVAGNLIGTGPDGLAATLADQSSTAIGLDGVQLDASHDDSIGYVPTQLQQGVAGNTIANNGRDGIEIIGGSTQNRVLGNRIGLGGDGSTLLPNGRDGILVDSSTSNDIGFDPGGVISGNIIAGNGQDGLALTGGSSANQVAGNLIGTTGNGTIARPNLRNGIYIDGSDDNSLGVPGQTIATGAAGGAPPSNLISGNDAAGIEIDSASGNQIFGDYIGTTLDGEGKLGNGVAGVFLNEAPGNTVGGTAPGQRNVISNQQNTAGTAEAVIVGIQIFGTDASGNGIAGNFIGTDASGTADFGNTVGVYINNAPDNTVGPGNVISGNEDADIQVFGNESVNTVIQANIIGLNASDTANLTGLVNPRADPSVSGDPRTTVGVEIDQALHTTVAGNRISGNYIGVEINGNATIITSDDLTSSLLADFGGLAPAPTVGSVGSFTVLKSNIIGVLPASPTPPNATPDPTQDQANGYVNNVIGVYVLDSARNLIGVPGAGNMILGHKQAGIELDGTVSKSNLIQANTLTDNLDGVFIRDAQNNTIGGSKPSQGNTITDDHTVVADKVAQSGVYIDDVNSTGNVVEGNTIKGMKYYGVLFYNTPVNSNTNLEVGNQVSRSGTADFRIYNGPGTKAAKHATHKTTKGHRTRPAGPHPKGPRHLAKSHATRAAAQSGLHGLH